MFHSPSSFSHCFPLSSLWICNCPHKFFPDTAQHCTFPWNGRTNFYICRVKGHFSSAEAGLKSLHSIFINVTSQWPVTSLLLIAFSIVPFAETPTMWVSSIFGNEGGLAPSTWEPVCGCTVPHNHALKHSSFPARLFVENVHLPPIGDTWGLWGIK